MIEKEVDESMKICICGGGHLGHVVAGFLAAQEGNEVRMLTRRPQQWSDTVVVTDPDGKVYSGRLAAVTSDASVALRDADIALLCLPGYSIREELMSIKPHLEAKTAVGTVVSSTGFFFQAFEVLDAKQPLFGFQRVPFISRTTEYGHSAQLLGYKPSLNVAIEQCDDKDTLRAQIETLFKCPVALMGSYYEVSLTNSNPILHTSRLYTLWHDHVEGQTYDRNPQFYCDWDNESSETLIAMDCEFQQLLLRLPVRRGAIPTILDYYESHDAESLTRKLNSIAAFKGLTSPMKEVSEGRWAPDFTSRYFTEDFPYGLRFIHDLAHEHGVDSPVIDRVFEWGINISKGIQF